jgi:amidohydrolase
VVTIGSIHGGVRGNIIPDRVEMTGTIRTFDEDMRRDLLERIRRTTESVAQAAGARATVVIDPYAPVTFNDPHLTRRMVPTLEWAAGAERVSVRPRLMGAEDFAHYQKHIPGFYFWLGVNEKGVGESEAAPNHSPYFFANEDALVVGVRAMAGVAWDYLAGE